MMYSFKTTHTLVFNEDAVEIAAMFLYEQQNGNNPEWIHFPGRYETKDFFSVNEADGNFLVSDKDRKVILLDSRKQAEDFTYILGTLNNRTYKVYQGGVNSDGFIAGQCNNPDINDYRCYDCPDNDIDCYSCRRNGGRE